MNIGYKVNHLLCMSRRDILLLLLFVLACTAYLHRVPGLLGDEASEGENVHEILSGSKLPILGERSYIGVLTDYLRMPFIWIFGYSTLALRFPMVLVSIGTFFLAYRLLYRHFGEHVGSIALVFFLFSPIYLSYQRLGWAITLFPFFTLFLWYIIEESSWKHKWMLAGLVAGLALQTHILFLPSLIAICIMAVGMLLFRRRVLRGVREVMQMWTALIGFWAGFALQFGILALMKEDQGDPGKTTQLFGERMADLLHSLPVYISGSSFVAQYTGDEFSYPWMVGISILLLLGVVAAVFLARKPITYALVGFIIVHTIILLYMVDRYSLRYFVVLSLGVWLLAGVGWGSIVHKVCHQRAVQQILPVGVALLLMLWMSGAILVPFLRTGGSVEQFSLGNRETSANAFLSERALISCLRGMGSVRGEREPIQNILTFYSHIYDDLQVVDDAHRGEAQLAVLYAKPDVLEDTICPSAYRFRVVQLEPNI